MSRAQTSLDEPAPTEDAAGLIGVSDHFRRCRAAALSERDHHREGGSRDHRRGRIRPRDRPHTIALNGSVGPTRGGRFAYEGGSLLVVNATISDNVGMAVTALQSASVELRGSTAVTVPEGASR